MDVCIYKVYICFCFTQKGPVNRRRQMQEPAVPGKQHPGRQRTSHVEAHIKHIGILEKVRETKKGTRVSKKKVPRHYDPHEDDDDELELLLAVLLSKLDRAGSPDPLPPTRPRPRPALPPLPPRARP